MSPVRQIAALAVAAVLVGAAFIALGRGAHHEPVAAEVSPGPSAEAGAAQMHQPPKPSDHAGQFATGASGSGDAGMDIGDILEPMAAQLADVLEHLREQCAAARRSGPAPALSVVTPCVAAGEATASTVEFVRGTLASEAGRNVSGGVRSRWTHDLDAAAAEVHSSLAPVRTSLGQALASGAPSPAAFRDLAHLRDRIDRVLTDLDRP